MNPVTVALARRLYTQGATFKELADRLGVNIGTVRNAVVGESWRQVRDPAPVPPRPVGAPGHRRYRTTPAASA